MSAEVLASDLKNRLHLRTKTVGADRIKKAKDNNEDIAVLSMFLPKSMEGAEAERRNFRCGLGDECMLGDMRASAPGNVDGR